MFENGDRTVVHAFDGFAKLSSWRFHSNSSTAFFSTKFLESDFYTESMRDNTIAPFLLFLRPDPPFSMLERFRALIRGLDNMNVNVYRLPAQPVKDGHDAANSQYDYVALSDYTKAYTFSPRDLSTGHSVTDHLQPASKREDGENGEGFLGLGGLNLGVDGTTFLDLMSSAHPQPEPGTPNHLNFQTSVPLTPFSSNRIQLVRIRSTQHKEIVASWSVDRVPYMHSFSVTRTHALILAQPFYVNVMCMALKTQPFLCLDWHEQQNSTLYVVRLRDGHVRQMTMANVFTMHHVNAFNLVDDDDEDVDDSNLKIIMDLSTYKNPDFVGHLQLSILRDPVKRSEFPAQAELQRYMVDLGTGTVERVHLTPPRPALLNFLDMPTLNEGHRSKPYCYVYGLVLHANNETLSSVAISKRDMCGRGRDRYWIVPEHYPVEPVFVPNPQGVAEDDGVVLVPMIDGPAGRSYMAVLDARDLSVVSRAYLPTIVPYSLHGRFFTEIL
jgi:carotenoid cleavage dioxygenase-like enzyme